MAGLYLQPDSWTMKIQLKTSSRELAYDFFLDERSHIAEDGHQRPARGPTRKGGSGWPPYGTFFAQYFYIL